MALFDVLGQEVGIRTAVDDFYVRVIADPQLTPYFSDVDMATLRSHQAKLLMQVTGGPQTYGGRELADSHQPLDITAEHFNLVVGHLVATLTSLGAPEDAIDQVVAALAEHRDDVVAQPAAAGS